jgi:60 kDa SS-A/Ro ribonucleoprotein
VLVSDTESWVYKGRANAYGPHSSTGVMNEWQQFAQNQQRLDGTKPKLICIDLQPVTTTLAPDRDDILNIDGFSDAVFSVVTSFLDDGANRFVTEVEGIEL